LTQVFQRRLVRVRRSLAVRELFQLFCHISNFK
jgi:hypothetical protein